MPDCSGNTAERRYCIFIKDGGIMKLQQLEYVIEIAREGSITGAARKLYQAQPNISIALKELEAEIGIQIFWRTGSGMTLTPEGEEFFIRANKIINEFHALSDDYTENNDTSITFKVAATRSSYITTAVGTWINRLNSEGRNYSMHFLEMNASKVIDDTGAGKFDIGVIRVPANQSRLYDEKLSDKKLTGVLLKEFSMSIMTACGSVLENYDDVPFEKLRECTEIMHGDEDINLFRKNHINPDYDMESVGKIVYVYDRGSKMSMLHTIKDSYMWVAPMPKNDLMRTNTTIKKCSYACVPIRDIIVYNPAHPNMKLINSCIESLQEFMSKVADV